MTNVQVVEGAGDRSKVTNAQVVEGAGKRSKMTNVQLVARAVTVTLCIPKTDKPRVTTGIYKRQHCKQNIKAKVV